MKKTIISILTGIVVFLFVSSNVDVERGICMDSEKNGKIFTESEYNYISYKYVDCKPGDKIVTLIILNPLNNEPDDIIARYDFVK